MPFHAISCHEISISCVLHHASSIFQMTNGHHWCHRLTVGALTATSGRSKERKEAICNASIMLGKIWKKAGEIPWETWKLYEIVRFLESDPDPPTISRKFRALPPDSRKNTPEGKTNSKRFDFPTTFHWPHPTDLPEFPSCNGNGKPDPKQSSYGRHFGPP